MEAIKASTPHLTFEEPKVEAIKASTPMVVPKQNLHNEWVQQSTTKLIRPKHYFIQNLKHSVSP